jgi:hypothetical protein
MSTRYAYTLAPPSVDFTAAVRGPDSSPLRQQDCQGRRRGRFIATIITLRLLRQLGSVHAFGCACANSVRWQKGALWFDGLSVMFKRTAVCARVPNTGLKTCTSFQAMPQHVHPASFVRWRTLDRGLRSPEGPRGLPWVVAAASTTLYTEESV